MVLNDIKEREIDKIICLGDVIAKGTDNIDLESYQEEIRNGKYRDMNKIYDSFEVRGIDKRKI